MFINSENISINDLLEAAYDLNPDIKCEQCHKDYLQFCNIKDLLEICCKKKKITIKESISFLENKGIIDNDYITTYYKFKRRFVNGIFDYCHHNTLISFKKLENLLKQKLGYNYKQIFDNIKYNHDNFYCCPHYKKPEKIITINLSDINLKNKAIIKESNTKSETNKNQEFLNNITPEKQEIPIWEKKKTNYKKFSNKKIKSKIKKYINQEIEINYNKSLLHEVISLNQDYLYALEKEQLEYKIEQLEKFYNLESYNILIENKIFKLDRKLKQNFSDYYIQNSFEIEKNISDLLKKQILIFNQEISDINIMNINTKPKLIEVIKDIKYNILFGNEIIESCQKVNSNLSLKIIDKLEECRLNEKNLIKNYNKIKNGSDNILDINNQNQVHHH